MKDNVLAKFILFLRNLFRHGNFDNIDAKFDLLTETGETAIVVRPPIEPPNKEEDEPKDEKPKEEEPIEVKTNVEEPKVKKTNQEEEKDFSYIDDETLRKIYETIHQINEFEKKSNRLRKLKFAKRDKSI